MSKKTARELAAQHPAESIRQQIAALPYRSPQDPAAALVTAIREDWAPPAAYLAAQKEQEKKTRREERNIRFRDERETEERDRTERSARAQACWNALRQEEQAAVEQEAVEALRRENTFLARLLDSGVQSAAVQQMLDRIRERILLNG